MKFNEKRPENLVCRISTENKQLLIKLNKLQRQAGNVYTVSDTLNILIKKAIHLISELEQKTLFNDADNT